MVVVFLGFAMLLLVVGIYRKFCLVIPLGQVAVIHSKKNGGFYSFRSSGRYLFHPGIEENIGTISTASQSTQGCLEVHTQDGCVVTLEWVMDYKLDPCSIENELHPSMASILLTHPTKIAVLHIGNCLVNIIGRYTLDALFIEGILQKVNAQLMQSTVNYLAVYGIKVEAIKISLFQWSRDVYGFSTIKVRGQSLDGQKKSQKKNTQPAELKSSKPIARTGLNPSLDDQDVRVSNGTQYDESIRIGSIGQMVI